MVNNSLRIRPWHVLLEIQVLAWDRQKNVTGSNRLKGFVFQQKQCRVYFFTTYWWHVLQENVLLYFNILIFKVEKTSFLTKKKDFKLFLIIFLWPLKQFIIVNSTILKILSCPFQFFFPIKKEQFVDLYCILCK